MFPLEYPSRVIRKHCKAHPVVLDPFCGRGTTLFAARNAGLTAWGIDSSPVAVAIARAKLAYCDPSEVIALAEAINASNPTGHRPDSEFFKWAYHEDTLTEIVRFRTYFQGRKDLTDVESILLAAILGCLHGPLPKNPNNSGYFSNQMPRTYASKPDYAVRYWKAREMAPKRVSTIAVLNRKISRLIGLNQEKLNSVSQVIEGDATSPESYLALKSRPSLVITSPPYYGMRSYVQDQWVRNWFLGGPDHVDYSYGVQLNHGGKESFASSLGKVWSNVANIAPEDSKLHMYVRFGVIPSIQSDARAIFVDSLHKSGVDWRIISTRSANSADAGKRQADQMKANSRAAVELDFHVVLA